MSKKDTPFNNPFGALKLKKDEPKKATAAPVPPPPPKPKKDKPIDEESALFLEAVGEVEHVRTAKTRVGPPEPPSAATLRRPNEEAESLARLAELVSETGEFDSVNDDAFLEASVRGLDPNVMRKLRAGDFTVQANLDLHGLTREQARPALELFIHKSKIAGHRCVLVVTGKGLNSPDQVSVLRSSVQEWLTRGKASRPVLGLCSARPKDGGAGAVYVLLRR